MLAFKATPAQAANIAASTEGVLVVEVEGGHHVINHDYGSILARGVDDPNGRALLDGGEDYPAHAAYSYHVHPPFPVGSVVRILEDFYLREHVIATEEVEIEYGDGMVRLCPDVLGYLPGINWQPASDMPPEFSRSTVRIVSVGCKEARAYILLKAAALMSGEPESNWPKAGTTEGLLFLPHWEKITEEG